MNKIVSNNHDDSDITDKEIDNSTDISEREPCVNDEEQDQAPQRATVYTNYYYLITGKKK